MLSVHLLPNNRFLRHEMLKMFSHGYRERLHHQWMPQETTCDAKVGERDMSLGYEKLFTLFLVLCSGYALAVLL